MPVEEFIVSNVQWLLPTWFLRLLVRLYRATLAGRRFAAVTS